MRRMGELRQEKRRGSGMKGEIGDYHLLPLYPRALEPMLATCIGVLFQRACPGLDRLHDLLAVGELLPASREQRRKAGEECVTAGSGLLRGCRTSPLLPQGEFVGHSTQDVFFGDGGISVGGVGHSSA